MVSVDHGWYRRGSRAVVETLNVSMCTGIR